MADKAIEVLLNEKRNFAPRKQFTDADIVDEKGNSVSTEPVFPLPYWDRARVRGKQRCLSASPPIEGEQGGSGSVGLLLVIAIFLLLVPHEGDAQPKEKVRVALGSISVNSSIIPIGQQAGLFSKHGLDIEPTYLSGGEPAGKAKCFNAGFGRRDGSRPAV